MGLKLIVCLGLLLAPAIGQGKNAIDDFSTPTVGAFSQACQPVRMAQRGERLAGDQELAAAMCFGYFLAIQDGNPVASKLHCASNSVNLQQRALVFLKWADENPEMLDMERGIGVHLAMMSAFPCPN